MFNKNINQDSEYDGFMDEPDKGIYDDTYDDFKTETNTNAELTKILIETDAYINRLQLTLENKYMKKIRYFKDGREEFTQVPTQIPNTIPLANSFGISQIIGRVKGLVSHVISTGNIDKQTYSWFNSKLSRDIPRQLIVHRIEWGIKQDNLRDIRRIIVDGISIYLTKPMNDKERGYNYGTTLKDESDINRKGGFLEYWRNKRNDKRGVNYG